ncbi:MAG: sodium:solute symporter, partial [Bacteroidota bacterium]
ALTLGVDEVYVLVGAIAFIFGYMMFGGANSMVYTNMVQASLMLVVAVILLGSGLEHFEAGIGGFLEKLNKIDPNLTTITNAESPLFRDFFEIIFCQIVIGVAIVCQPHIITKSLLLKSDRDVNTYLTVGIVAETLFFLVVFAGLYARLEFPDLMVDGTALKMDGIMSAYVVKKFSVVVGLVVVLGLIFAGISTLEGLIQSVSASITSDILEPLAGKKIFAGPDAEQKRIQVNRGVIVLLGLVSFGLSYDQLMNPNLSVALFAQNGVYAYFSAAFIPVLFGTFLKDTPFEAAFAASITAIIVHFTVYYSGMILPGYMDVPVRNPAIASTLAILAAVVVGLGIYAIKRRPTPELVSNDRKTVDRSEISQSRKN